VDVNEHDEDLDGGKGEVGTEDRSSSHEKNEAEDNIVAEDWKAWKALENEDHRGNHS
jgi:hypothetical protein